MSDVYLILFLIIIAFDTTICLIDYFLFKRKTSKLKLENAELENKINYLLVKKLELEKEKKESDN